MDRATEVDLTLSACSPAVDAFAKCDRGELLVRSLFFVEVRIEQPNDIVVAEAFCPGNQRSIPGNLIVLDGLRRSDNGRIQHIFVRDFTGQLVRLADQTVDGRTLHPFRLLAKLLEDLVKPADLVFRFLEVILKTL